MSTSSLSFSVEELLKLALDRYNDVETKMAKVMSERDCLKKEVKELRMELIESDKTVEFHKTRVRAAIEQNVSTEKPNPDLSDSADETPLKFIRSTSNKNKRKVKFLKDFGTGEEEAGGYTNNSGVSKTEHDVNQACKSHSPRVVGATSQINPIINKIKENLTEENVKKFEESCFGHLLKNNKLKFQGTLLLQLMQHMDMGASSNKRLVFNINNSSFHFGPRQFSLITGLRLGTVGATAKMSSSSSTHNQILRGINPSTSLQNIDTDFLNVSRVGQGKDELALKLALLHFLYGVLFAGNYCRKIDHTYLVLIEDLHKFNTFPWGRIAYQFLASSMLRARRNYDSVKPRLYIYGLSLALQVWAYEVMPSLAEYCAVRANNSEDRIPRILRWSTPKKVVLFKDLEKFFTKGDEARLVLHGIRASAWELEMLTTGTIPPLPKKRKLGCATTQTTQIIVHHVVRAKMQAHPLEERCSSPAAGDVISDKFDGGVDEDVDENNEDEADVSSNSQSNESDDDDISDGFMNKLVAGITGNTI